MQRIEMKAFGADGVRVQVRLDGMYVIELKDEEGEVVATTNPLSHPDTLVGSSYKLADFGRGGVVDTYYRGGIDVTFEGDEATIVVGEYQRVFSRRLAAKIAQMFGDAVTHIIIGYTRIQPVTTS